MKTKRIAVFILVSVFVAEMLFSVAYIAFEFNHKCSGEDCPICHELRICADFIYTVGLFIIVYSISSELLIRVDKSCSSIKEFRFAVPSPIDLRVKLSN